MPIDLGKPLKIGEADEAFLDDLQGNILKGHGREHTINMFLQFDSTKADEAKSFVRQVADKVTSAKKQLEDTKRFKETHQPGDVFAAFFLTFAGYRELGIKNNRTPNDGAFRAGLQSRVGDLKDAAVADWDAHFKSEIHALVIIADDTLETVHQMQTDILAFKPASVTVLGEEIGLAMRNKNGDGIEHFGYVDGRSQPLLLQEDIDNEADTTDGINVWSPAFPLKQALVKCKGGTAGVSFGSYLVFRKLEQNVSGFKSREDAIAVELGLPEKDKELAGAMMVGRFEDGTPVVLQQAEGAHHPVPNQFQLRKRYERVEMPVSRTHPQSQSARRKRRNFCEDQKGRTRSYYGMARRGITYGTRIWENDMPNTELDENHFPPDGVGLLFMAYQSDIAKQFEFTQRFWVNNEDFVQPATGIDPVIGQGNATVHLKQPKEWGKDDKGEVDFHGFVKMKGGEYFYAPCRSFLRTI